VLGGQDTRIRLEDPAQAWSWSVGWDTLGDFSLIQEGVRGDRIYFKQNGNVGIGTVSPDNKLDVAGVIRGQSESAFGDVLIVGNDSKIVDVNVLHTMGIYSNTDSTQGHVQLGSGGPKLSGINGNFGIGTVNPQSKLDVGGGLAINGIQVINGSRQWVGDPTGLQGADGADGATGATGPSGPIGPQGSSGTSSWVDGSGIVTTSNSVGLGVDPLRMLHLKGPGPEIVLDEDGFGAWRIGPVSSGFVFDATDSNVGNAFRVMAVQRNGSVQVTGVLTHASDARLKKNVSTIPHALDKVLDLRGVHYQWKNERMTQGTNLGFIAQEMEQVIPELVIENAEGYKSVDYS
jgi:hypothetical protein